MGPRKPMRKVANLLPCLTIPPEEHNESKSINGILRTFSISRTKGGQLKSAKVIVFVFL